MGEHKVIKKFSSILTTVVLLSVLASCDSASQSNAFQTSYGDYSTVEELESKISCLEDLIYTAERDLSDAENLVSDIELEFYWINETSAWYPNDINDLEYLIDEADEAFAAINNAKTYIDDLYLNISDVKSDLLYFYC